MADDGRDKRREQAAREWARRDQEAQRATGGRQWTGRVPPEIPRQPRGKRHRLPGRPIFGRKGNRLPGRPIFGRKGKRR